MKTKHLLVALLIALVWGVNFIAIHIGLEVFPPFLLSTIRFGLSAFPWIFFLPRPKAPLKLILGYGVFTFALQFGLLFSGIHLGLSAGLASLVLQVQMFFSMGLAALFFKDRPSAWKIVGSLISFTGIGIVASHADGSTSLIGLILTLLAALSWSIGNMFTKKVDAASPLALVVWGNLVAFPFMAVTSLLLEGPEMIGNSFQHVSAETIAAVIYIVYVSTHVGYGAWGYLLKSYPTATVVPFTLLVPVVGFLSSALILNEDLLPWKITASVFVMAGLVFNLMEKQVRGLLAKRKAKID